MFISPSDRELVVWWRLLNLLLIVCSQQGNSMNLYYATDVVFKGTFTVTVVSTCVYEWNCRVVWKQVASGLTRKLTKLAPKLIRGLWFLKQKIKKQVTCQTERPAEWTGDISRGIKAGHGWSEVTKMRYACFLQHSLWRRGQGEAQDDCRNKRSYLSQKECGCFNVFTLPNTLLYVRKWDTCQLHAQNKSPD